jgi:hypothetical protein
MDWIYVDKFAPTPGQEVWVRDPDGNTIRAVYKYSRRGGLGFFDQEGNPVTTDRWATLYVVY